MLVLMTCTMVVAGADHDGRRRADGDARGPRAVLAAGRRASRCCSSPSASSSRGWCPSFRLMQTRIDAVNRILREQITGIRVVRAFVREPHETAAVRRAPTTTSPRSRCAPAGWMATMFPPVMLVLNVVQRRRAVVRRAPRRRRADAGRRAHRVPGLPDADPDVGDDGDVHADDGPARGGLRRPDRRGARHRARRRTARRRRSPSVDRARRARARGVELHLPGRRARRCSRDVTLQRPPRADRRDHRLDRRRQDHAGQPGAAALRRHRRRGAASTASTSATSTPSCSGRGSGWCRRRRSCSPAPSRSNLRYGKPDATDEELWQALEIAQARDFVEAMPERARRADRAGRHQRLRRPAAAARDRPGAGHAGPEIYLFDDSFSALDLATDARLRAALRAGDPRRDRGDRRPAGLHDPRRRPDPRARGRRRSSAAGTHDELLDDLRDLPGDRRAPS